MDKMSRALIITIVFISFHSFAQQIPQYSQFQRNQFMANPAAAGIYDFIDVTLAGRWQWLGVADAPRTSYLAFSVPLNFKPKYYNPGIRTSAGPVENPSINTGKLKHTVGGQVIADQYGAFRKLSFLGTYALHIPMSKDFNLSFGVKAGLSNNTFLADKAQVLNVVDPTQTYVDNTYTTFLSNQSNKYILDLSAGLYFYGKGFYLGLSSQQLTRDLVEFGQGTANFNPQMHYNVISGYKFKLNSNLTLTPNVMLKFMYPAPVSIDFNTQVEYNEWLWFGLGYRHTDALIGMFGLNISNRFRLGYSFDFSISKFKNYSSGGHELVLGLMLGR
jgi:type IX secretion system PorP/SprF family membrane protein